MKIRCLTAFFLLTLIALTTICFAGENRLYFVSQNRWSQQIGFFFDMENSAPDGEKCTLDKLRIIMGIADGKSWRYPSATPQWEYDRDYQAKAVISPEKAQLWLDGKLLIESPGAFKPTDVPMTLCDVPSFTRASINYAILVKSISITVGTKKQDFTFTPLSPEKAAAFISPTVLTKNITWALTAQDTVTIETSFRFARNDVLLRDIAPVIDRYGQCKAADWPDKIRDDKDFQKILIREESLLKSWGQPKGYDEFGGNTTLGWHEQATGFFTVTQHNGKWWLISPKGNPCFFRGMCNAPGQVWEKTPVTGREFLFEYLPPKDGKYADLWTKSAWGSDKSDYVALQGLNLMRKFGDNWMEKSADLMKRRVLSWGFSGLGKWCQEQSSQNLPFMPVLHRWAVPNLVSHPDIFDPAIKEKFTAVLHDQMDRWRTSPRVIGWSMENEAAEIIPADEINKICAKGASVPSKRALVDYALKEIYGGDAAKMAAAWGITGNNVQALYDTTAAKISANDLEKMRQFYEGRYYEFIYTTVKSIDPNHLYFASWVCNNVDTDWRLQGKYCDVLGYDHYGYSFDENRYTRLFQEINKPVLLGEFSYPTWHNGLRGYGQYGVF
ncbi:MAG TPA: hypothetical protein VHV83_14485, partial [Armatimonadota bacterium]|nr:hypothetical protein [Armatimonadota bacterium]